MAQAENRLLSTPWATPIRNGGGGPIRKRKAHKHRQTNAFAVQSCTVSQACWQPVVVSTRVLCPCVASITPLRRTPLSRTTTHSERCQPLPAIIRRARCSGCLSGTSTDHATDLLTQPTCHLCSARMRTTHRCANALCVAATQRKRILPVKTWMGRRLQGCEPASWCAHSAPQAAPTARACRTAPTYAAYHHAMSGAMAVSSMPYP